MRAKERTARYVEESVFIGLWLGGRGVGCHPAFKKREERQSAAVRMRCGGG